MLKVFDEGDGGELVVQGGDVLVEDTPMSAIYLALFGGSLDEEWFGNLYYADEEEKKFISTFENQLKNTIVNVESIKKLKSFLDTDLKRLVDIGVLVSFDTSFLVKTKDHLEMIINFVYDLDKSGVFVMNYFFSSDKLRVYTG